MIYVRDIRQETDSLAPEFPAAGIIMKQVQALRQEEGLMMMAERQIKILNMIQEDGSVQVEELAKELDVSPMTIRRDLEKLQKEGLIERCHGGAVSKTEVAYADKSVKNHGEKERIAEKSVEFIREGTTVYLDAGTTTYEIAKRIMDMENMTVITNDLEIALLMKNSKAELILCGGYVQKSTGSTLGYYTTQMIADFRFDTGFFGAAAISGEFHVLTPTMDKAFLKRQLVKQCRQSFLTVDDSKFNRQGMNRINCLADYTGIITDHEFKEPEKAVLRKQGVRIISVNQEISRD